MDYGIGWTGECSSGRYQVVDLYLCKHGGNIYDKVLFAQSGEYGTFARTNIKNGRIKDKFGVTVHGIGSLGEHSTTANVNNPIYNAWKSMLLRCKNNLDKIDKRWTCFSNFEKDFEKIPFAKNYIDSVQKGELKKWALDKDCVGEGVYSLEGVIYLPYEVNQLINQAPSLLVQMGAILPTKEQIINFVEDNFESMIR